MSTRIKFLLAACFFLGALPVLEAFLPMGFWISPAEWALASIPLGLTLALSFWCGMGGGAPKWRVVALLAGLVYICLWPSLAPALESRRQLRPGNQQYSVLAQFAYSFSYSLLEATVFTGVCLSIRYRRAVLRKTSDLTYSPLQSRLQYSLIHALGFFVATAVIVASLRGVRSAESAFLSSVYSFVLHSAIGVVLLLGAIWSCLNTSRPRERILLVVSIALCLALPVAHIGPVDNLGWWRLWQYLMGACLVGVPMVIILVSLLIVRSDGYRLLPIPSAEEPRSEYVT